MDRISAPFCAATGYSYEQWSRVVMYRELFTMLRIYPIARMAALEISPGGASPWPALGFAEYLAVGLPDFDICERQLDRQFDVIIADQVFEHLLWPYRAARNVHAMLKPGGLFVNTTPFLIRVHNNPVDCSRWTELGIKHFLAEAGFAVDEVTTGSWGSLACARANLVAPSWARVGWGRSLRNESEYPISVWAIARKQAQAG
jgi:hypothetical protein